MKERTKNSKNIFQKKNEKKMKVKRKKIIKIRNY